MGDFRLWLVIILVAALTAVAVFLRKNQSTYVRFVVRISKVMLAAIAIVVLLRAFVLGVYLIPSESMVPTLEKGDCIITNKFIYKLHPPRHGDVVVFKAPEKMSETEENEDYIKRVVGLPGDEIQVWNGYLYRNGEKLNERYIHEAMIDVMGPVRVPDGTVFVMGDNRNKSFDSRDWGPLDEKLIIGRANMILLPRNRMRYIR